MGLRDRGYVLDFYIPLFSGVEAARRSRFRLVFPSAMYDPYIGDGGTGNAGGLAGGDGGFGAAVDTAIHTPSITFPNPTHTTLCPSDTITSDSFQSSNGQTHAATRWWVELLSPTGALLTTGTGVYVLDTGPDTTDLITYLLSSVPGLMPGASYRVFNRYKGSGGGWSDFSLPVTFVMNSCAACAPPSGGGTPVLTTFVEVASAAFDGSALTTHTFSRSAPSAVSGWTSLKCYLRSGLWDDHGNLGGNVATINSTTPTGATGTYSGPDALISNDGTGALTGSVTNTVTGGCGYNLTLVWTGFPP